MSKNEEGRQEAEANPYNRNKAWHTEDVMPQKLDNADEGLFVPNPDSKQSKSTATAEGNPEDSTEDTSATMDKVQDSALNVEANPYTKVDYKKRYDDLKRYYDRKLGEWNNKEQDLKVQLQENRPKYQPPKSKEELEAFKNDYPDIYGVVETVSHLQSQNEVKSLQDELEGLKKANSTLQQKEAALELSKYHPDFEEIKESDDFHNWADTQPMEIKNWIYENNSNGALAARAIDLYKKDRGLGLDKKTKTEKKQPNNQGADLLVKTNEQTQVPDSKEVLFKRSDIQRLSDAEFMKYEKDILKAQREGRIID
jgi:uncharacterized protein YutD|nr:hypothetical protein [uncultured Mediterranean phage uvMED]